MTTHLVVTSASPVGAALAAVLEARVRVQEISDLLTRQTLTQLLHELDCAVDELADLHEVSVTFASASISDAIKNSRLDGI